MTRWPVFVACVAEPGATSTARFGAGPDVLTVNEEFREMVEGAEEIVGRGPLKRYGGE
jgi:hypothetical protein